jgi:hypothetical protein
MVDQRESGRGDFWYVVRAGNGKTLLTSEMYDSRAHACRAARAFIAAIDPVPVRFSFWFGGQGRSEPQLVMVPVRPVTT